MDSRYFLGVQLGVQNSCTPRCWAGAKNHFEELIMPLTDTKIKAAKERDRNYKLADGEGLYLLVRSSGTKSWQMKYRFLDKEKTLTLGKYPEITIKEARRLKFEAKSLLSENIDPSQSKQEKQQEFKKEHEGLFLTIAENWYENQLPKWSPKYAKKSLQLLSNWVFPTLGKLAIKQISSRLILDVLRTMEKNGIGETTRKTKGLIEQIFTFAIAEGHIDNNPVTGIEKALKALPKVIHQRHLPPNRLGELAIKVEQDSGNTVVKLGFLLLMHTFVRTKDIRLMEWSDIDFDKNTWTIPVDKIKMNKAHTVPLSRQALEILDQLKMINGESRYVMKSPNKIDQPVCENVFLNLLKRIKMTSATTPHGLRGTASTHLNELGEHPDVIEACLSHVEKNQVRKAYNHAEYSDRKAALMQKWADIIETQKIILSTE